MKWIGLTGGIGSGKSTVANCFRRRGIPVLDADEIAKKVVEKGTPGLQKVVQEFGHDILQQDQGLDRRKLGQLVFSDPEKLEKLELIIHPLVQAEIQKQRQHYEKQGHVFVIYDVPLLFEKKLTGFDAVIVVASTEENQKQRLRQRNRWTDQEISSRLAAQISMTEKVQKADFVIQNNSDLQNLEQEVDRIIVMLKAQSK